MVESHSMAFHEGASAVEPGTASDGGAGSASMSTSDNSSWLASWLGSWLGVGAAGRGATADAIASVAATGTRISPGVEPMSVCAAVSSA